MKVRIFSAVVLLMLFCNLKGTGKDLAAFFEILAGTSEAALDNEIARIEAGTPTSQAKAHKGALLMKKADFMKGAGNKVRMFKGGAALLEAEISRNPDNAEYRFIRLTIQEHAPGILKYNKNLREDKELIISNYKRLSEELRKVIRNYSLNSKVIKTIDLQ